MLKFKQWPVGKQVTLLLGIVCAILVAIGGLLFFSLRSMEHSITVQQSLSLSELTLIEDSEQSAGQIQATFLREILADDPEEIRNLDQTTHNLEIADAQNLAEYKNRFIYSQDERQLYEKVARARNAYLEKTESGLVLARANRDADARAFVNSTQAPAYDEYLKAISGLTDYVKDETKAGIQGTAHFLLTIRIIGDVLAGMAIIIAIGTGLAVVGIARRMNDDNGALQTEVAERKQAEFTLHESEEKFRQLADNISDVFWITSPDLQKMFYVSPGYELIWGRTAESLFANPHQWVEVILPEDRGQVLSVFATLMKDQQSVSAEYRITRPDGTIRWILDRGFQVRNAAGGLIRLTGIASDITERKKAEESLRLLNSAVIQSKEAITITDAKLDSPGPKIIFVNPAFTKMTGYATEEALGKTPRILQGPRTDKAVLSRLRKNLEQGEVFEGEAINYRKDGTEFDLEWQIAPIRDVGGEVTHYVSIQRDITGRKRIEARLFQSQKMETVGKLAGGVAHEFNSILTAIIGQSEFLLTQLQPASALGKSAREIRQAAERAATLTRQLLAYGRKQILQPEIIDLNRMLFDMHSTLQHLMSNTVDVQIIPAGALGKVKMDPGQMEQVIVSVAMNAADAMPNGGKLTLETANVTLDEAYVQPFPGLKAGDYVQLALTDTGSGMSDEVKARVFEPFFSTKGVGQGTGLGLATCYGIVKQSEGHISVYSEPGRGTTFKIYLPRARVVTKPTLPPLKSSGLPVGAETILLAEDDPSLLEMAATLLRRLGYTVITAVNGVEALNLKNQRDIGHIDLLLTDVVMPHMSGKELSDRIRLIYPATRILFTSAYAENAIVHQGILDEGVTLLQKPFTPSALANKVREVLDRPASP